MAVQIVTLEEHTTLKTQVEQLHTEILQLRAEMQQLQQGAQKWYMQTSARMFFIGKGGKPVYRLTFKAMVECWIQQGVLVEGLNYRVSPDGIRYISEQFLKGEATAYAAKKLKRA